MRRRGNRVFPTCAQKHRRVTLTSGIHYYHPLCVSAPRYWLAIQELLPILSPLLPPTIEAKKQKTYLLSPFFLKLEIIP